MSDGDAQGSPDEAIPAQLDSGSKTSFTGQLPTTVSHQILTLLASAFLCFEFLFIELYFDNFWFSIDLSMLGLPAILLAVGFAHVLLLLLQSERACRWAFPILKGKPPALYTKWIQLNEEDLVFGARRVRWEVIDELELSWLGNLIVKSRAICGPAAIEPDVLLKFPFAAASFDTQQIFLKAVKLHRPDLLLNKRLTENRNPAMQKGAQATQLMTAGLMSLLLLDVGYSSFFFLEMLKNMYLAETELRHKMPKEADEHFKHAEYMRSHPLPISWVTGKFLKSSNVAADIWEQRARILWLQGKHAEAIDDSLKAIVESPKNLRHRLYQTRLLVDENRLKEADEQLNKIIDDHKHSLMPRLYILAISKEHEDAQTVAKKYKEQVDYCYEDTFEDEPHWPPGGNRFFTELFYSDDLRFLMDRYIGTKYPVPEKVEAKNEP